ncbi:hypothetical protein KY346_06815 [Candidatus Woesearchaeota archaeon]|nr:hypothetical protein [Candidatus Woesearchaeota archaeon]
MDNEEFLRVHKSFDELEKRGSFYDMALNLISKDFEIEAYLLILATWNFASFRYVVNSFDLNGFKKLVAECKKEIKDLKGLEIRNADLDSVSETIKKAYTELSLSPGVKFTGAAKLLHLMNKDLFVMWDGHIRKHYNLGTSPEDYLNFLKKMQEEFKEINWEGERTFAKVIDEYNYVKFTLPSLKEQKEKRKRKN